MTIIRRFADLEELCRAAAEELYVDAREAIATRDRFTIALSGGSTPRRMYEILRHAPYRTRVAWDRVDCFFGDERAVGPDHQDSNFRMTYEAMLRELDVPKERIHRIEAERDVDRAARAYESEIASVFGIPSGGEPPSFDLVLLGLGTDGHTASLFPFSSALEAADRWVVADRAATPARVTMTARLLNAARRIWFLVSGAEKAEALRITLSQGQEPRRVPARLIQPTTGTVTWFIDRAAARLLEQETSTSGITVEELPGAPIVFERSPEPCAFVIFGAGGDLTRRKLIPALYNLMLDRLLPEPLAIIGASREAASTNALHERLRESTEEFSRRKPLDPEVWTRLAARIDYVAGSLEESATFARLAERLVTADRVLGTRGNRIYYLAVPPDVVPTVLDGLARGGLLYEHQPAGTKPWSRIVIEKPFGRDLASARALNRRLAERLDESQVFRIDHYLGKETVQNILIFRFGNTAFEPLLDRRSIDHVQITAVESIGVAGRGRFYDTTGVLRDVVQSHLLHVLSLCASEVPISFAANDVRDAKVHVMRSLHPITGRQVTSDVVFAQYRGYSYEEGVSPGSRTPTYVAMKILIDNWRWHGVPIYLRAGKKLARQLTEVSFHFQPIPLCLFRHEREGCQNVQPNVLTLRIQPDEGISLRFAAKAPGDHLTVGNVLMNMTYATAFGRPISDAYERLLLDVMRGDPTLFARRDEIEQAWRFVDPILQAWEVGADRPAVYEPGSTGPREADELIERDGRKWREIG
jgi:glucose-6-phosphate 1-dehydrogenase